MGNIFEMIGRQALNVDYDNNERKMIEWLERRGSHESTFAVESWTVNVWLAQRAIVAIEKCLQWIWFLKFLNLEDEVHFLNTKLLP